MNAQTSIPRPPEQQPVPCRIGTCVAVLTDGMRIRRAVRRLYVRSIREMDATTIPLASCNIWTTSWDWWERPTTHLALCVPSSARDSTHPSFVRRARIIPSAPSELSSSSTNSQSSNRKTHRNTLPFLYRITQHPSLQQHAPIPLLRSIRIRKHLQHLRDIRDARDVFQLCLSTRGVRRVRTKSKGAGGVP